MQKFNIAIQKHARYFTYGNLTPQTENVWFVLHGYGQTAEEFLSSFKVLDENKNFLIAPEALNKFYFQGFAGKVGANWMTNEDREIEINDYVNYLNRLFTSLEINPNLKLNLLGFSQGASTATRWFANSNINFSKVILWGGEIAKELVSPVYADKFNSVKFELIIGDRDVFMTQKKTGMVLEEYQNAGIKFNLIEYEGKHAVEPENVLKYLG